MLKTRALRVYGRVQGVGYRYTTKESAQELGLTGFVRNEPDGSVYIEVSGESDILDLFERRCYEGPGYARVQNIEISNLPFEDFTNFRILY